jgi:nucleoside-diphosphate-sugar epimerase
MILLTGSSGFLGRQIVESIGAAHIKTLARHNADYLFDLKTTIPVFSNTFETVIHAAAKAHSVPKTDAEKQDFFDVNVKGTQNLLRGLEQSGKLPKHFVFISTIAVYGIDKGELITEDAPLLAVDPYGQSKIQAERIISEWGMKHNVIITLLRLPLLAGANPPGNLAAMINGIKKGYYFNIAGGDAKKSMVLISDVAKIIPVVAPIGGFYNLTDGVHPSFFELSKNIAEQLNKPVPHNIPHAVAKIMALAGDIIGSKSPINSNKLDKITSGLTFDDTKAHDLLGWQPVPVLNGLKL